MKSYYFLLTCCVNICLFFTCIIDLNGQYVFLEYGDAKYIDVGNNKQLFADDYLTDLNNHVDFVMNPPYQTGQYASQAKESMSKLQGTFTDPRDGQAYNWLRIGDQVWMARNLNYASSGSWCYNRQIPLAETGNCDKYGRLYNWETAMKACPPGWHLPSDAEWTQLTDFVGSDTGTRLKARSGWDGNGDGTDDYGFSALPGGYRYDYGNFYDVGYKGGWWTSTEGSSARSAGWRGMSSGTGDVDRRYYYKNRGFSLRCVRDN